MKIKPCNLLLQCVDSCYLVKQLLNIWLTNLASALHLFPSLVTIYRNNYCIQTRKLNANNSTIQNWWRNYYKAYSAVYFSRKTFVVILNIFSIIQ